MRPGSCTPNQYAWDAMGCWVWCCYNRRRWSGSPNWSCCTTACTLLRHLLAFSLPDLLMGHAYSSLASSVFP